MPFSFRPVPRQQIDYARKQDKQSKKYTGVAQKRFSPHAHPGEGSEKYNAD
ncbi:hypothetical protein CE91St46_33590 [Eubacteriales bacterium]|nr:hypothetical protein CE91St46_33590 [Eubacteriales bacterium]GKH64968.1 hypothetical protein CE91St47_34370 [Eubacteriales bacterium]